MACTAHSAVQAFCCPKMARRTDPRLHLPALSYKNDPDMALWDTPAIGRPGIQPTITTQYASGRGSSGTLLSFLLALLLGAAALPVFIPHATTGGLARIADRITGLAAAYD